MSATVQTQAVQYANGVIAAIQVLADLRATIAHLDSSNTQLTLGTVLSAFKTVAVNADGSLAADSDVSPNTEHPMNPNEPGQSGLTRAVQAYSVGVALSILQEVAHLLDGGTVAQQTAAPNIIAQFVGG